MYFRWAIESRAASSCGPDPIPPPPSSPEEEGASSCWVMSCSSRFPSQLLDSFLSSLKTAALMTSRERFHPEAGRRSPLLLATKGLVLLRVNLSLGKREVRRTHFSSRVGDRPWRHRRPSALLFCSPQQPSHPLIVSFFRLRITVISCDLGETVKNRTLLALFSF